MEAATLIRGVVGRPAVLAVAAMALAAPPASADIVTESFDGHTPGTAITNQIEGVQLVGGYSVFNPQHVATQSEPHALRRTAECTPPDCANGAYRLEMDFERPVRSVSLYAGDDDTSCVEFSCPDGRLAGYDADGNLVYASDAKPLTGNGYAPITNFFSIATPGYEIHSAVFMSGKDDVNGEYFGAPTRAQVDNLTFDILPADAPPPPPPAPTPPPRVLILEPADGALLPLPEAMASGTVEAPEGVSAFCIVVDGPPTIPSPCPDADRVRGGAFTDVPIRGLHAGTNTVTAWVRDRRGRTDSRSITVHVATPESGIDIAALSLDVTQGIQRYEPPEVDSTRRLVPSVPYAHATAPYEGVDLVSGKKTVVRMQASVVGGTPAGRRVPRVNALLHGYRVSESGALTELAGSPLSPNRAIDLDTTSLLGELRAAPGTSFNFTLPDSWAGEGRIALAGEVNPPGMEPRIPECDACGANNAFGLRDVEFFDVPTRTVVPLSLVYTDDSGRLVGPPSDPGAIYAELRRLAPFNLRVLPYQGYIDVTSVLRGRTSERSSNLLDLIEDWEDEHEVQTARRKVVGFQTGIHQGSAREDETVVIDIQEGVSFIDYLRPLTSAAHELFHQLGSEHAGNDPACYPDRDDRGGSWPPDGRGRLQGWGLDVRENSGGVAAGPARLSGPYRIIGRRDNPDFLPPSDVVQPAEWVDFMSYCADIGGDVSGDPATDNSWISVRSWSAYVTAARILGRGRTEAAQAGATLRVAAVITPDGTVRIGRIEPGPGGTTPPAADTPYRIVVLDAAGGVVSDTPVLRTVVHTDDGAPESGWLTAEVPAAGAAVVQVVRDGAVVAERRRSASPPQVRVLAPRRGTRVGRREALRARWRATDADGDSLPATVEFTRDGRRFRTIATGIEGGSLRVPGRLLSAGRRARVRVTVNDGFDDASALSPPFRAAGAKPLVRIHSPARGARVSADSEVLLEGEAYDDRGRPIPARRLVWRSGKRRLGRGTTAGAPASRIGRRVTLTARDGRGRRTRRRVRVRVARVAPVFLALKPRPLSERSRRLRLRVASTLPARLVVRGRGVRRKRVRVTRRTRTVRVRVGRRDRFRVRLRLSARGRATRTRIEVGRG